jgi:hypothetical protein
MPPVSETSNPSTTTYIAAKLRASDGYLGFGAEWAYTDYDGGFKIAAVPAEHAPWFEARLRSGLDLFGSASADTLAAAVRNAEEAAGPYEVQGRVG